MKVSQTFTGEYLKAADLGGAEHSVIIASVELKELKDDNGKAQNKLLLMFQNRKKGLLANKTNSSRIAKLYGDETDGWVGKEIVLYTDMVQFGSDEVEAIRVRGPMKQATKADDFNDAVPF